MIWWYKTNNQKGNLLGNLDNINSWNDLYDTKASTFFLHTFNQYDTGEWKVHCWPSQNWCFHREWIPAASLSLLRTYNLFYFFITHRTSIYILKFLNHFLQNLLEFSPKICGFRVVPQLVCPASVCGEILQQWPRFG